MSLRRKLILAVLRWKAGLIFTRRLLGTLNRSIGYFEQSLAQKISPDGRIIAGPFAGMLFPIAGISSSMVLPKLAGCYEEELHPIIENLCRTDYSDIVDIGCGEGYYAVGLAMRIKGAQVHAFDVDPLALAATRHLAEMNGIAERVSVKEGCSDEQLRNMRVGSRLLLVSDCEGAEFELLQPNRLPSALTIDLVVECHDSPVNPGLTHELLRRFSSTHDARIIPSRPRKAADYPFLKGLSSGEQQGVLEESRTPGMNWLILRSKTELHRNNDA